MASGSGGGGYYVGTGQTMGAIRAGRIEAQYRPLPVDPTWDPDRDRFPSYGHRRPVRADDIERMGEAEYERRTSNGQKTICPLCNVAESLETLECDCGDPELRMLRALKAAGIDVPGLADPVSRTVDRLTECVPLVSMIPAGAVAPPPAAGRWGTLECIPYAAVTHYWLPRDSSGKVFLPVCGLAYRQHLDGWVGVMGRTRRAAPTVTVDPDVDRCSVCESQTSNV